MLKKKAGATSVITADGKVENKTMKSPHVWALLFGLAALCAVLTWIIGIFCRKIGWIGEGDLTLD